MTKRQLLALGTIISACVAACGSPSIPTGPGTAAPGAAGPYVLSGVVFETLGETSRPLAGAQVHLWQQGSGGSRQIVGTDQNGRYSASVPAGRVFAASWDGDFQQPCLASAVILSDATLDVQLVRTANLASTPTAGPRITGVVYATTPSGRVPLRGALISVDALPFQEVYVAVTRTDDSGRFALCRMNAPVGLLVGAVGYEAWMREIAGTTDAELDVELKPLP